MEEASKKTSSKSKHPDEKQDKILFNKMIKKALSKNKSKKSK